MLKSKKGVFARLTDAAFGIKRPEYRKVSRDSFFGSCPVIDADFVEISEEPTPDSANKSKLGVVSLNHRHKFI